MYLSLYMPQIISHNPYLLINPQHMCRGLEQSAVSVYVSVCLIDSFATCNFFCLAVSTINLRHIGTGTSLLL